MCMQRLLLAVATAIALVVAPAAGAWTWPTNGVVVEPFAFDVAHPYAAGQHRGIDVAGEAGATVHAPASGVVTFAGTVPSAGRTVTIETPDGWSVTLVHLGSIAVTKGATVAEGDGVGTIGASGESEVSAPHVHLGVRRTAEPHGYVDPLVLLPPRVAAPAPLARPDPQPTPPVATPSAPAPSPGGAGGGAAGSTDPTPPGTVARPEVAASAAAPAPVAPEPPAAPPSPAPAASSPPASETAPGAPPVGESAADGAPAGAAAPAPDPAAAAPAGADAAAPAGEAGSARTAGARRALAASTATG